MRTALTLLALIGGVLAANAYPEIGTTLCSDDFGEKATLTYGEIVTLKIGDKIERFEAGPSLGTGLNGQLLVPVGKDVDAGEPLHHTVIEMDWNQGHEYTPEILIFRDRVFWPCETK